MALTSTHWGVYRPLVVDGELREMEPAPWDTDPSPIGSALPHAITGRSRIRRPAVRASFLDPATRRTSGARRGQEPFVEVPWDEALDLVATELQRIREEHGNQAIFGGSYGWSSAGRFHHAQSQVHRFLNAFGGYTYSTDSYSLGAGRVLMPHIVDHMDALLQSHTSWDVLARHCELFVSFGGLPAKNAQISPGGASAHLLRDALARMAQAGTVFINISPIRSDLDLPGAQWLPIRPGSDTALMLGIAHVLISESLHDEAFLETHTVGYDKIEAYVLGTRDGVAKNPAWAAERTGIDAASIIALARRMAGSRTMVNTAYALQRARYGEQPFWMTVTLAALLGQIGLPGGGFGLGYGCMNNTGSGRSAFSGPRLPQGQNPVQQFIPVARLVDMLLSPGGRFDYNGRSLRYPDIRLLYWAGGNVFHHHQDINRLLRAWRRPEAIVTHEQYWTAHAKHSDIVLPATTMLERNDIGSAASDRYMIAMKAAIAPVGEARDDYTIFAQLAQRLGIEHAFTEGRSAEQWLRHLYEESRARAVTNNITLPSFDTFWEIDKFEIPLRTQPVVLLESFRQDPQRHPLPTPSGRIELYSKKIASFAYEDCPGHAVWFDSPPPAHPLHLLSNQPTSRLHSQYDQGPQSRAHKLLGREPLTLHPADAGTRGIRDGDIVRVFNERGAFLAAARLSEDIRPGVVQVATGAWYDPLDSSLPGSLDKHGNPNLVTPDIGSSRLSQGCAAQSAHVDIERWEGAVPPITAYEPPAGTTTT